MLLGKLNTLPHKTVTETVSELSPLKLLLIWHVNCWLCKSVADEPLNRFLMKSFLIWPSNSLTPTSYRCCSELCNNTAADPVNESLYKSLFGVSLD